MALTRENGRHHSREHQKQKTEEQKPGVVVRLGRLIADVEVEQTNQDSTDHVRRQSQPRQCLTHTT